MLQVTEDTPPDMLAGAMDLTIHLPTGRTAKMSVERSTPMMDLLVQITTAHQLQLSNYTLQALGVAPSSDHRDKILPFKPNTPIGTLDTQHIKVVPKVRSIPVPKNIAPGQQPFESTFRLKVHLPRNQLFVIRVSRNVLLHDIMKKVCEEKNLDPMKYEFKHPANLDQTLDPKLTLSDYQITEIIVVAKGSVGISQAFSSTDIMALRKEEERKQMHNKTGGGVFNLIFRRGKSSMGSGSVSSDTRSISPTHSDDSRSVTPPGVVQKPILPPPKQDPPSDRPKPPQRKRRPAPKPPQQPPAADNRQTKNDNETKTASTEDIRITQAPEGNEVQMRRTEGGLLISHSRTSSDSSGYHEASVLSENCNTSLPRRPKSAFVGSGDVEKLSKMHSQSSSNLSNMASHSKSTMSLGMTGRKKKAAPPPPPLIKTNIQTNIETASPVVASQSANTTDTHSTSTDALVAHSAPQPLPRSKTRAPQIPQAAQARPIPRPRNETTSSKIETIQEQSENKIDTIEIHEHTDQEKSPIIPERINNDLIINEIIKEVCNEESMDDNKNIEVKDPLPNSSQRDDNNNLESKSEDRKLIKEDTQSSYQKILELQKQSHQNLFSSPLFIKKSEDVNKVKVDAAKAIIESIDNKENKEIENVENKNKVIENNQTSDNKPPEVVGVIPKTPSDSKGNSKFDSFGRKRFQNSSLTGSFEDDGNSSTRTSVASALNTFNFVDEFADLDDKVFSNRLSSKTNYSLKEEVFNELYGIHNLEEIPLEKNQSISSLRSLRSLPGVLSNGHSSGMKKWNNFEDLDDLSNTSQDRNCSWVVGESEPESLASHAALDSLDNTNNILSENKDLIKPFGSTDSGIAQETNEKLSEPEDCRPITPPPPPLFLDEPLFEKKEKIEINTRLEDNKIDIKEVAQSKEECNKVDETNEVTRSSPDLCEIDWEYQLPSPPQAFRDTSPVIYNESTSTESATTDFKDSMVTSPELFENHKPTDDTQSIITDTQSVATFIADEPPLNTLSLENLEKRKSLVYNRELSTSLKASNEDKMDPFTNSLNKFETTFIEVQKSSHKEFTEPKYTQKPPATSSNTLPNFKISTYDKPKEKIKVFEDDTIRSSENGFKSVKQTNYSQLNRFYLNSSVENVAAKRNSIENKPGNREYSFYRSENVQVSKNYGPVSSIGKTEYNEDEWSPNKPVGRSRSYLTLNGNTKHRFEEQSNRKKSIERSNSLYDVSGLQSLGVMRLIQSKLNTPTTSLENLNYIPENTKESSEQQPETPSKVILQETNKSTEKVYKYQGPPSINMGTWSERPKRPISVKEDADYKLGNNITSKLIVNTTNNNVTSNNRIEVNGNNSKDASESSISIKVNGTEVPSGTTESKPGNVVIKIGSATSQPKIIDNQRFINHTTAVGYRKPFTDVNRNGRPHSIAIGSDIDLSRVPVVRSVELKKPFKDFGNTSVTQIGSQDYAPHNHIMEEKPFSNFGKPKSNMNPVVRGFKTLPREKEFETNSHVPFSQVTLRKTPSSNIYDNSKPKDTIQNEVTPAPKVEASPPPPPPMAPKLNLKKPVVRHIEPVVDTRDQLLQAIRNFGGKKGLRPAKV